MKRFIAILLVIITAFSFASCKAEEKGEQTTKEYESVDLDLTSLTSTMVYSEVYNMVTSPESYVGKKIRIKGSFYTDANVETGDIYYACVIQDATACCQQGIQFVTKDSYSYPVDFPRINEEIVVEGVFDFFVDERNIQVLRLTDCDIIN